MHKDNRKNELELQLMHLHGPLIGGIELQKCLGFRSAASFRRAIRLKLIDLYVFEIPNRKGLFAVTTDVANWLYEISESTTRNEK